MQSMMLSKLEEHRLIIEQMAVLTIRDRPIGINPEPSHLSLKGHEQPGVDMVSHSRNNSIQDSQNITKKHTRFLGCSCSRSYRPSQQHFPWCTFFQPPKSKIVNKKFNYRSTWLGISVELLLPLNIVGRGLSIYPMLRLTATVPSNSGICTS
ncbi:hypothetical protein BDW59DRAFT_18888 [Aspergillus cavernicola]|uniref:Uncharacterized protein n=1 Tax=Aspergillus cavernicola TaxID=176166 RepID=A0ABR4IS58_9EURO